MKVKFADQTAFAQITGGVVAGTIHYTDLSDSFPELEPGDAIVVRKVTANLNIIPEV